MLQSLSLSSETLQHQVDDALEQKEYGQAVQLIESLIALEPEQVSHYWRLGLAHLLGDNDTEAQFTWNTVLSHANDDQIQKWTADLVSVLQTEAERQAALGEVQLVWRIRQHICEIAPTEVNNLLRLLNSGIQLDQVTLKDFQALEITPLLQSHPLPNLDVSLLLEVWANTLEYAFEHPSVQEFTEACIVRISDPEAIVRYFLPKAHQFSNYHTVYHNSLTCYCLELCLRLAPSNLRVLHDLSTAYGAAEKHESAIEISKRYLALCQTLSEQVIANGLLINRMLRTGASWQESRLLYKHHQDLLKQLLIQHEPKFGSPLELAIPCVTGLLTYYFEDAPAEQRPLQNQLAQLIQDDLHFHAKTSVEQFQEQFQKRRSIPLQNTSTKLKIGYISNCMRQHSVGWLSRWLFEHHDRDRFEVYTYHIHQEQATPFTKRWFISNAFRSAQFDGGCLGIAKHINENDQVDILVDLDSITSDYTYGIMALKPAPVQVSWLGYDASGLPAIDYFIADPYVLPDNAQTYYTEKIWRLSNTYIAVDGFEIGVPTLRREQLGISDDAVIYLSAQQGCKRHPDNVRSQLQIIHEVPNSYLLIKGLSNDELLKQEFIETAEAMSVNADRLRFLSRDLDEQTHRANLAIADIVLDTFPYNGATTTMETLWMGIPMVTLVGQQFAARNSYGMMMNVGVTEGIAWTEEEYIKWGIRMGKESALRQQVSWKLKQSRLNAPLWNGKQFAHEVEHAYEQMWTHYIENH
jgi:predicted O-linked N-acetylglucosamine transferase (SPINDLY family)